MCPNPEVTLHCTPPYTPTIPNPALGYMKGFLKDKEISVKNVYWNLILTREIQEFTNQVEFYSEDSKFSTDTVVLYTWLQLMTESFKKETPLNLFLSSIYAEEELDEFVHTIKDRIDTYINQHNLHEASLAGFTMKTFQWLMSSCVISRLKEMNPDIKILIGGLFNEAQAYAFMRAFTQVDYAIWGEGEYPLWYLAEAVREGGNLHDVPQLVYRGNTLGSTSTYYKTPPLDEYPFADHSDFFEQAVTVVPASMSFLIPIWGSRACPWNKCKFCVLNEEYTYRTRSPENIVKEIEYQSRKHDAEDFIFVDTELPGNKKRFESLLNLLLQLSSCRYEPYHFTAEISPVFIDDITAHRMELAAFTSIQVGFEAATDGLLRKMRKRHRFAHNIQALKLGSRYTLRMDGLNIIRAIPPETHEDIIESCSNLRFLRFLLPLYQLNVINLELCKGAPFYEEMTEAERKAWNYHWFWTEIGPTHSIDEDDRFEFLGFIKEGSSSHVWNSFELVMRSYAQQARSYTWIEYGDCSFIEEKGPRTYRYVLDRDETDILIFCDVIKSFSKVKENFSHMKEEKLLEILGTLKDFGLVYYDKDMRTIISVLDVLKKKSALQV